MIHGIRRARLGISPATLVALVTLIAGERPAAAQESELPPELERGAALYRRHCLSCHSIGDGERVASDLIGIVRRRDRDWLVRFTLDPGEFLESDPLGIELLEEYEGMRMPAIKLPPEEIELILDYVDSFEEDAPAQPPPRMNGGADNALDSSSGKSLPGIFLFAGSLLLGALLWKSGKATPAKLTLVIALGLGYWSLGGRRYHVFPGSDLGYAPEQPIAFSHAEHAGDLQISCVYCHNGIEKSPVAGIPPLATCMNCHRVVRKRTTQTEASPEIAKLIAAWEAPAGADPPPLAWVRVHDLPDFASFDHQAHVNNRIQCQECHGPIETMERVRQVSDLSMGWCIDCHRQSTETAPSYWMNAGGPLDCAACHH